MLLRKYHFLFRMLPVAANFDILALAAVAEKDFLFVKELGIEPINDLVGFHNLFTVFLLVMDHKCFLVTTLNYRLLLRCHTEDIFAGVINLGIILMVRVETIKHVFHEEEKIESVFFHCPHVHRRLVFALKHEEKVIQKHDETLRTVSHSHNFLFALLQFFENLFVAIVGLG